MELPEVLPELKPIVDVALDIVVSVVNRAKEQLGQRQTLKDLAHCRELFSGRTKLYVTGLRAPLSYSAEMFIDDTIRCHWKLTEMFSFCLRYKNSSRDESSHYYYYEAVFSQPTAMYPIPQATATVYFRVLERFTHPPVNAPVPVIEFRLEGERKIHDIRFVTLIPDWLLAIIQMKITLFRRIEQYGIF